MEFKKILMIDNFDSFTYNLVDYFKVLGCEVKVFRNTVSPNALDEVDFDLLVLSPGPSIPKNAGNMFDIIRKFYQTKPIFGICLGHQALIEFFGGTLKFLPPQHGKADNIIHDGQTIYSGLKSTIEVARYHSLAAEEVPNSFEVSARSQDGTVMSIRHKLLPIEGVQFHPESVLSMRDEAGMAIIRNVINGRISASSTFGYQELMKLFMGNEDVSKEQLEQFIQDVKAEKFTDDQMMILLVALSAKLKNPIYCARLIEVLQAQSSFQTNTQIGQTGIDICGTGGSGLPRINTSTLTGILLSYLGLPIIKHGNKASSGRFGSFNLLESLGIPFPLPQDEIENAYLAKNLAFLFAPNIHPIVGKFSSARIRVGVPTIFNTLGPLLNPYNPAKQFIGTPFKQYHDLIFETGILLGKTHFVVVRGEDNLDEISVSAPTHIKIYKNGERKELKLTPEDFGIETIPFEEVKSDHQDDNIRIAKEIMAGELKSEHYKLIAVNAAFIYSEFVEEMPLPEAYQKMVKAIESGGLGKHLEQFSKLFSEKLVV
ncbi:MAG: anthranilate phosphoribosyltransferase [Flammeovirgaceae bacterium]|jgi:anthranilate phosphoribosyltransferase